MLDIEMTNKRFSLVQMFSLSRQEEKADLTGVASSKSTKKYTYNNQTYDYTGDDYYVEIKVSWVKKPVCVCVCGGGGGGGGGLGRGMGVIRGTLTTAEPMSAAMPVITLISR